MKQTCVPDAEAPPDPDIQGFELRAESHSGASSLGQWIPYLRVRTRNPSYLGIEPEISSFGAHSQRNRYHRFFNSLSGYLRGKLSQQSDSSRERCDYNLSCICDRRPCFDYSRSCSRREYDSEGVGSNGGCEFHRRHLFFVCKFRVDDRLWRRHNGVRRLSSWILDERRRSYSLQHMGQCPRGFGRTNLLGDSCVVSDALLGLCHQKSTGDQSE